MYSFSERLVARYQFASRRGLTGTFLSWQDGTTKRREKTNLGLRRARRADFPVTRVPVELQTKRGEVFEDASL